jgi:hypothetical protein
MVVVPAVTRQIDPAVAVIELGKLRSDDSGVGLAELKLVSQLG